MVCGHETTAMHKPSTPPPPPAPYRIFSRQAISVIPIKPRKIGDSKQGNVDGMASMPEQKIRESKEAPAFARVHSDRPS